MSEMADQDFQDLFSYLQPQSLTEDPGFIDSSMDGGFPEDILDTQESHSARIPAPWESEADIQLLDELESDRSGLTYLDFDTSADKGKGRVVEEESNFDGYTHESNDDEYQNSNREALVVNASQHQYQDAPSSYPTAPEYHAPYQSAYASLGYVHAGSDEHQYSGVTPASSVPAPNTASSSAPVFTAAGQISSRSIRRTRKPAGQSSAPLKEKKPVKQSKKKSLAEVRDSQSGLLWRPSPDQQWIPAVYHNDIWNELLQWTDQVAASHGGYDQPPAKGIEAWNRTAFCLAQKSWGRDRESRPAVLFFIQKTDVPNPPKSQDFFWDKRRVIDRDNLGMRWFDDLPATISSAIEDFRLDAIQKLNPNIEWEDIWGRTPNEFRTGKDPGIRTRPALTVPALSNRTLRFRREAGTLAWDRKDELGNEIALEFLQTLMGEDCIRDNNTFAFGRDLTPEEVDQLDEYLRVEKVPERAQARRRTAAARAAVQRQPQAGLQHVQQAPPTYQVGQQSAQQAQPPRTSTQRAPQSTANGPAQTGPRQPPAQVNQTAQGSSTSRYGASRFRQGPNAFVQSSQTVNSADPNYGAPNQNGKRGNDVTHEHQQTSFAAKRPRANDPGSVFQGRPDSVRNSGYPQLLQPRAINPLKRSNILSPYSRARGVPMQTSNSNAAPRSTNNARFGGHTNSTRHKRAREETDDEEEEGNEMHYKKARVHQASASQASGTRQIRRPAQRPYRPSQAFIRSLGEHVGTRAPPRPMGGLESNIRPSNEPRANGRVPYAASVASDNAAPAPNNGYMDITISVPIGSEIVVKPRNQTYSLVGTTIPGQNVDWKVVDRMAPTASYGAEPPMSGTEQEEGDPDWQGHQITARSSNRMANRRLTRTFNPASSSGNVRPTVEDCGPPPGLPEDFIEEGFEPEGYEDAVQYQNQSQTKNYDLSSSTMGASCRTAQYTDQTQVEDFDLSASALGASLDTSSSVENQQYYPAGTQVTGGTDVLDFAASASSPRFGDNLTTTPEIDYFSQLEIPLYTIEELDQLLNEADDVANADFMNDMNAIADQNPTETFAQPQADTLGVPASDFDDLTYEQIQAGYQDTYGRPLFDDNFPLGDDNFDPTNDVDFLQDQPLADIQGQGESSSPNLGEFSGLTTPQQVTPETTVSSDPVEAPEVPVISYPPHDSDSPEPDWDALFDEDLDKVYVEEEL